MTRDAIDTVKYFDLWDGRTGEIRINGQRVIWHAVKRNGRMQLHVELPPGTNCRTLTKAKENR